MQDFDREVQDMVTANKLSASRVKSVTEAAMANIEVSFLAAGMPVDADD